MPPRTNPRDEPAAAGSLQLVGPFCDWRLETRGLVLEPLPDRASGWREHRISVRLHSGELDFQVVDRRLGFGWRLFPGAAREASVPKVEGPRGGRAAVIGGKDDGHGLNFHIAGEPLGTVTVSVWLQEGEAERGSNEGPRCTSACVTYACGKAKAQVAVTETKVQFPAPSLNPLDDEILQRARGVVAAKLQEKRYAIIRKVCWQLQREYLDERVQGEVAALRRMYPSPSTAPPGGNPDEALRDISTPREASAQGDPADAAAAAEEEDREGSDCQASQGHGRGLEGEAVREAAAAGGEPRGDADDKVAEPAAARSEESLDTAGESAPEASVQELHYGSWFALTGWAGPLLEETWQESGLCELLGLRLPEGCGRREAASAEQLLGVLCGCGAHEVQPDGSTPAIEDACWDSAAGHIRRASAHLSEASRDKRFEGTAVAWRVRAQQANLEEKARIEGGLFLLWDVLTGHGGPLLQDAWLESGLHAAVGRPLPLGGVFGECRDKGVRPRREVSSMYDLWSFLCRCAAADAAGQDSVEAGFGGPGDETDQRVQSLHAPAACAHVMRCGTHLAASARSATDFSALRSRWKAQSMYAVTMASLSHLWSLLTAGCGPLSQETWDECGFCEVVGMQLPTGGLVGSSHGRRVIKSEEELWALLCCWAAVRAAGGEWEAYRGELGDAGCHQAITDNWHSAAQYLAQVNARIEAFRQADDFDRMVMTWRFRAMLAAAEADLDAMAAALAAGVEDAAEAAAVDARSQLLQRQQKELRRCLRTRHQQPGTSRTLSDDPDALFEQAVVLLPSVKAARLRALGAVDLEEAWLLSAKLLVLGEQRPLLGASVFEANRLSLLRLRCEPSLSRSEVQAATKVLGQRHAFIGTVEQGYNGFLRALDTRSSAICAEAEGFADGCRPASDASTGACFAATAGECFQQGKLELANCIVLLRDTLRRLLEDLGQGAASLRVEPRALVRRYLQSGPLPAHARPGASASALTLTVILAPSDSPEVESRGTLALHRHWQGAAAGIPAIPGAWSCYHPQDFAQESADVRPGAGFWSVSVQAEDTIHMAQQHERAQQSSSDMLPEACESCQFVAKNAVVLPCPSSHRICRTCLAREIRQMPVPTCPACVKRGQSREWVASHWELFCDKGLRTARCMCAQPKDSGQDAIDPGSRVVLIGKGKDSALNGKTGRAVWWDRDASKWDVLIDGHSETSKFRGQELKLARPCPRDALLAACPCWPNSRGLWPVSLGNRCCVRQGLNECTGPDGGSSSAGYPLFHGDPYLPFDWMNTSLQGVLFFLRHDFRGFLHTTDVNETSGLFRWTNHRSALHSFPHHNPKTDGSKLMRRVDRFRQLCKHARDRMGARPLLFIRHLGDSDEFGLIDATYALVRLWAGAAARLCFVSMLQTPDDGRKLLRHRTHPRVLIYLCGEVGRTDFSPAREVCRYAVLDEAGLLADVPTISSEELRQGAKEFSDSHTEGWLLPLEGRDPAFFPDYPPVPAGQLELLDAARAGDVSVVERMLGELRVVDGREEPVNDANVWDRDGRTPLHHLALAAKQGLLVRPVVTVAAQLVLGRGDPNCRDLSGRSALDYAAEVASGGPLWSLLAEAALDPRADADGLREALALLNEPLRRRLVAAFRGHGAQLPHR